VLSNSLYIKHILWNKFMCILQPFAYHFCHRGAWRTQKQLISYMLRKNVKPYLLCDHSDDNNMSHSTQLAPIAVASYWFYLKMALQKNSTRCSSMCLNWFRLLLHICMPCYSILNIWRIISTEGRSASVLQPPREIQIEKAYKASLILHSALFISS
jgi:hypothetical protein